jgi:hypothetical protein
MSELVITRLMENPLGQIAPAGHRGDIIRVDDGVSRVYLLPAEFESLDDDMLRAKLSQAVYQALADTAAPAPTRPSPAPSERPVTCPPARAGATRTPRDTLGSLTGSRQTGRRAQPLW